MHGHDHAHGHDHDFGTPEMAAHIELEGEVLAGLVDEALGVLEGVCRERALEVRRVLDLGSGPGVAACLLAERFPAATVVAADGSAAMLERAVARAGRLGLGGRVEPRLVQLPDGLPTLGPCDVAWASMALHHLGDETAALRAIGRLLGPTGLLALVERADPLRISGVDLPEAGAWERVEEAWQRWFDDMRAALPGAKASGAYPAMLAAAGLDVVVDRTLTLVLPAPLDGAGRRFLRHHVERSLHQLEGYADAGDLEALASLVDAGDEQWDTATIEASRLLFVAVPR